LKRGLFKSYANNSQYSLVELNAKWQDLNLIQTLDIAQGGSDNRARRLGKTRSK
jgi:hypothetical protein